MNIFTYKLIGDNMNSDIIITAAGTSEALKILLRFKRNLYNLKIANIECDNYIIPSKFINLLITKKIKKLKKHYLYFIVNNKTRKGHYQIVPHAKYLNIVGIEEIRYAREVIIDPALFDKTKIGHFIKININTKTDSK